MIKLLCMAQSVALRVIRTLGALFLWWDATRDNTWHCCAPQHSIGVPGDAGIRRGHHHTPTLYPSPCNHAPKRQGVTACSILPVPAPVSTPVRVLEPMPASTPAPACSLDGRRRSW